MVKENSETGTSSFGPYLDVIYCVGTAYGRDVLVKYHRAWRQNMKGQMQDWYATKLRDAVCWIGTFRSAAAAIDFYLKDE